MPGRRRKARRRTGGRPPLAYRVGTAQFSVLSGSACGALLTRNIGV